MFDAATLAVPAITHEVGANRLRLNSSANHRPIDAAGCPRGELLRQSITSFRRPRDNQQSAGVSIQAMHDEDQTLVVPRAGRRIRR